MEVRDDELLSNDDAVLKVLWNRWSKVLKRNYDWEDFCEWRSSFDIVRNASHQIIGLEFSQYDLQDPIPSELGYFSALCDLNLSCNQLTSLPPEIGCLSMLRELNLSRNQLTSLPPEIGRLPLLSVLDLSNNQLTSLPPEIGCLSALRNLDLSHNQLTSSLFPEIGVSRRFKN